MPARVSVVIPLYNHSSYILAAVQSVLAQGSIVGEVIVIDDGSTDGSRDLLDRIGGLDPRAICWAHPNRGAHATINAGLMRATGEFVAILNSDDLYAPGRLERLAAVLDRDTGADLASSAIAFIDGDGQPTESAWHLRALARFKELGDPALALINANYLMTTSNFLFRRRLLDEVGLFAPLRYAHDLDFALRALALGRRFSFLDQPLLSYRIHSTNTISEDHAKVRREWVIVSAHYLHLASRRARDVPLHWARMARAGNLLSEHDLTRATLLCLAWFAQNPADSLEHSAILTDPAFNRALAQVL